MTRLLDILLSRQRRLLAKLDAPTAPEAAPPAGVDTPAADGSAEAAALARALVELESGSMDEAHVLLQPFSRSATQVRTLTTLARITGARGEFDQALELLRSAEALDPQDQKVWRLLAEACALRGLHNDELRYRRQLAFAVAEAPPEAFVELLRALLRASPPGSKLNTGEVRSASQRVSASAGDAPDSRVRFAEALYALRLWPEEARSHYAAANPCEAHERDVSARWMRPLEWCEQDGATFTRWTEGGKPVRRPSIAELSDAIVCPRFQWTPVVGNGTVALSGYLVNRAQLRSEDPLSPLLMKTSSHLELRLPRDPPLIEQTAVLVGGVAQYYHNTVELLSSLAIVEKLGVGKDLPIVVNDDLAPFQLEQLALLGYGTDRLIRVRRDQPVQFAKLHVPSRLVAGGRWVDPLVAQWYRERFGGLSTGASPSRKLYLSRAGTTRRRIENEESLIEALSKRGFEVAHPERLSVKEQVALFSSASHIVAPTGAALTNMLFAPAGAHVVVIYNKHIVRGGGDLYFDAIAASCEHRFTRIESTASRVVTGQRVIDADLTVDVRAVCEALD